MATRDDPQDVTVVAPAPSSATLEAVDPTALLLADRYEVLGLLGVGGMGAVYRARDRELDELVALKMLRRELIEMPGMLARFRQEVKLARKVTSPNVARTFDIGEHRGERFLTMELVEGESLGAELERDVALSVARVIAIGTEVCRGLSAAHAVGVVHCDLKPDNVLLAKDGGVKITDFGIAKARSDARRTHDPSGTPAYMAPEQVTGEGEIDPRADLYALGAMLYEMLTGELPWKGDSIYAVASARLVSDPPDVRAIRPEVRADLAELVLRCMSRAKEARPASAHAVMELLAAVSRSTVAPPLPAPNDRSRGLLARERALKNVAVLPIRNRGPAEDDYLADGLTDDLIDSLSMTQGLRARARGAVMKFKNEDRDPREIGRELGVDVVVEGSIQRSAAALRIVARLVSVTDGFQLWTKRFERPASELLAIGDEVARAVSSALMVETSARPLAPQDPVTLDLYLRARAAYQTFTIDGARRAMLLFEEALALSPDQPMLTSGYAMARMTCLNLRPIWDPEFLEQTLLVAERAVALAPELGEAQLALANLQLHTGQQVESARSVRLAVDKAPSNAEAQFGLGRLLTECGRFDDAVVRLEICRTIDPRVRLAVVEHARIYALRGEWDLADELMETARDEDDDSPYMHWGNALRFHLWHSDPDKARALIAAARSSPLGDGQLIRGLTALLEGASPAPTFAEIYGARPRTTSRRGIVLSQLDAEVSAYRGAYDEALLAVEHADRHGLCDLAWMTHCPLLGPLHAEPRFAAVLARVEARAADILAALDGVS